MPRLIDLTGRQFDRLFVIARAGNRSGRTAWLCRCECGAEVPVIANNLVRGLQRSCGCWHRENSRRRMTLWRRAQLAAAAT
jgi:hypothetical protein